MMRAAILMGALAVAIPAAARPQEDEASKTLRNQLRTIRLDVDFEKWNVRQLVDYLREASGINIVLDKKAGESPGLLTMKAKGVTIQSILRLLLKPCQIGYTIEEGVLMILPEAAIKSQVRLEIFDVRDVMFPIRDFPGVDISLLADSAGATFSAAPEDTRPEFPIVDLIKAHTGGKAWDETAQVSIQLNNGLLFVRQTPETIAQIRKVIDYLRQYK